MSATHENVEALFDEALKLQPEDREALVANACADNPDLRRRLEELLRAADIAGDFLPESPNDLTVGTSPVTEQPGDRIGRYKLLEKIGEGGCGIVFMAEQEEPVRRRVALKVIKPGMDTKSVIARFEAERQALAMMDHPNIAKVHDGGVTESGRPYFVMELVRGIRITQYCQEHQLAMRERLDLFTAVCSAVQHAHQKGIIHRDLKPSNILVSELDGRPVPKVIDFGIAKATEQKLTDKTLFTQFAQFVGTPAYMSPEQAAMTIADIDTRSDIYSLGVLLYELLTGSTPFDAKELLNAGFDEMRRIIRETEPPKPSTRLTLNARTIAEPPVARRSEAGFQQPAAGSILKNEVPAAPGIVVDPPQERRATGLITRHSALPTDLDWIVMKCLEKDRARRYETATGLAQDIQRHLNSEPVTARPASAPYRFQKMVRRHKLAFAAAGAVAAALVAGTVISTWQAVRATRAEREQGHLRALAVAAEKSQNEERKRAESEAQKSRQVARFLKDMLKGVGPSVALGRDTRMLREILDKTAERAGRNLKDQPEVEAELRNVIGNVYEGLGEYEKARETLQGALAITKKLHGNEHPDVAVLLNDLALVLGHQGELEKAEAMLRQSLTMERKLLANDADVSVQLNNLATTLTSLGRLEEAETVHREALAMIRKREGNEHDEVATSLNNLGAVLDELGKNGEAETVLREALDMLRNLHGGDDPRVATTLNNLANVVQKQNKLAESESLFREALALQRKLLGNAHPNVASGLNGLGLALLKQGRAADAEPLLREAVEIERKARKGTHPKTATPIGNLGRVMEDLRQYQEAESLYREAIAIHRQLPGTEHPDEVNWHNRLHNFLKNRGKLAEMETLDREFVAIRRKRFGDEHPEVAAALTSLADALVDQKKIAESEAPYREALAIRRKHQGDDLSLVKAIYNLAMTLNWLGKSAEVEPLSQEAAELTVRLMDSDKVENKSKRDALTRLVHLYQVVGKPDLAAAWRQKLAEFDKAEADAEGGRKAVSAKPDNQ